MRAWRTFAILLPGRRLCRDGITAIMRFAPWARIKRRFAFDGHFIDPRFVRNRRRYLLQCAFVSGAMAGVLLLLDTFYQTVLIAALGASSFVAFAAPSMRVSRPRCLIGGYLVGTLVGCGVSMLVAATGGFMTLDSRSVRIVLGALAVGITMLVMVTTDTEHPPGVAVALGFVLSDWELSTVAAVLTGIVAISVIKELAREHLIDLL